MSVIQMTSFYFYIIVKGRATLRIKQNIPTVASSYIISCRQIIAINSSVS